MRYEPKDAYGIPTTKNFRTWIAKYSTPYGEIIAQAEQLGYIRSAEAALRESKEGSIGQYGLTLDEAIDFLKRIS